MKCIVSLLHIVFLRKVHCVQFSIDLLVFLIPESDLPIHKLQDRLKYLLKYLRNS